MERRIQLVWGDDQRKPEISALINVLNRKGQLPRIDAFLCSTMDRKQPNKDEEQERGILNYITYPYLNSLLYNKGIKTLPESDEERQAMREIHEISRDEKLFIQQLSNYPELKEDYERVGPLKKIDILIVDWMLDKHGAQFVPYYLPRSKGDELVDNKFKSKLMGFIPIWLATRFFPNSIRILYTGKVDEVMYGEVDRFLILKGLEDRFFDFRSLSVDITSIKVLLAGSIEKLRKREVAEKKANVTKTLRYIDEHLTDTGSNPGKILSVEDIFTFYEGITKTFNDENAKLRSSLGECWTFRTFFPLLDYDLAYLIEKSGLDLDAAQLRQNLFIYTGDDPISYNELNAPLYKLSLLEKRDNTASLTRLFKNQYHLAKLLHLSSETNHLPYGVHDYMVSEALKDLKEMTDLPNLDDDFLSPLANCLREHPNPPIQSRKKWLRYGEEEGDFPGYALDGTCASKFEKIPGLKNKINLHLGEFPYRFYTNVKNVLDCISKIHEEASSVTVQPANQFQLELLHWPPEANPRDAAFLLLQFYDNGLGIPPTVGYGQWSEVFKSLEYWCSLVLESIRPQENKTLIYIPLEGQRPIFESGRVPNEYEWQTLSKDDLERVFGADSTTGSRVSFVFSFRPGSKDELIPDFVHNA